MLTASPYDQQLYFKNKGYLRTPSDEPGFYDSGEPGLGEKPEKDLRQFDEEAIKSSMSKPSIVNTQPKFLKEGYNHFMEDSNEKYMMYFLVKNTEIGKA